jgi:hypothetical protein
MSDLARRQFITLVGGCVAGWPLYAGAEQARKHRLGVLLYSTPQADQQPELLLDPVELLADPIDWLSNTEFGLVGELGLEDPLGVPAEPADCIALEFDIFNERSPAEPVCQHFFSWG